MNLFEMKYCMSMFMCTVTGQSNEGKVHKTNNTQRYTHGHTHESMIHSTAVIFNTCAVGWEAHNGSVDIKQTNTQVTNTFSVYSLIHTDL